MRHIKYLRYLSQQELSLSLFRLEYVTKILFEQNILIIQVKKRTYVKCKPM